MGIPQNSHATGAWRPRGRSTPKPRRRRGAMLVILAILMIAFMGAAALAIDFAQVRLARTELRTATDAAAKAAAESLSRSVDTAQARRRGIEIAARNQVMGCPLLLPAENFEFGHAVDEKETGRIVFYSDRSPINGVRVSGARTGAGPDGVVPFLLGRILERDFLDVRASSTATCVERDVVLTHSTIIAE